MSKIVDISGEKFNNLLVIERDYNVKTGKAYWKCLCDCGNKTIVSGSNLRNGSVKSCGCLIYRSKNKTHGMSKSSLYKIWNGMKFRCTNKNSGSYKNYGQRGISVCEEWFNNPQLFIEWALKNGYKEGLTIDRIDNEKDYCPENCRWISKGEQAKNRRMNYCIEYKGEAKTLWELCEELNLNYNLVHNRIKKLGWSLEKAISTPVNENKRNMKAREKYGNNKY